MKYFLALLISMQLGTTAFAQSTQQQISAEEQAILQELFDKNEWLYDLLMPEKYKIPVWEKRAKKSFSVHLRDSHDIFPHPEKLSSMEFFNKSKKFLITGSITYVGFFPKKYRYDVDLLKDGSVQIGVRVHFKNASAKQKERMRFLINHAQNDWNQNRYDFGIPYQFRFSVENSKEKAHFSVRLKKGTRGPYDTKWNPDWAATTIAHEIGHMMGLGDEYQTLSGNIDCIRYSLMCAGTEHLAFHHYHILRRLFIPTVIAHEQ